MHEKRIASCKCPGTMDKQNKESSHKLRKSRYICHAQPLHVPNVAANHSRSFHPCFGAGDHETGVGSRHERGVVYMLNLVHFSVAPWGITIDLTYYTLQVFFLSM